MILMVFPFAINATILSISVNYDIANVGKNTGLTIVNHKREYEEYRTGDDVTALGAYDFSYVAYKVSAGEGNQYRFT